MFVFFFFQAEDGIRGFHVTGVQTCALPISESTFGWRYPVGSWLNEIVGGWKYHTVDDKIGVKAPLEFAKIWRIAQARTELPVKFGTISADLSASVLTLKTNAYAEDK